VPQRSFFPSLLPPRDRMINDTAAALIAHEFSRSQSCVYMYIRIHTRKYIIYIYIYALNTLVNASWNWCNLADDVSTG